MLSTFHRKLSKLGKRFAFVRFLYVDNMHEWKAKFPPSGLDISICLLNQKVLSWKEFQSNVDMGTVLLLFAFFMWITSIKSKGKYISFELEIGI